MNLIKDYDNLRKLVIADQFLATLTPDLRIFIKERDIMEPEEMSKLADSYSSARRSFPKNESKQAKPSKSGENSSHKGKFNNVSS